MDVQDGNIRELLHEDDQLKWTARSSHNIKRFSQSEVEAITSQYKTMIGQGAFGKVYQGVLEDKSMVAVKKFNHKDHNMKETFAKELIVRSQINHRNVTRLIGYCLEEDALMMVIEYISGGNLNDILHNSDHPIRLDTRLRIATECAQALGYMHSHMYTQVIHGDIKPANILLDHNLNAKISDFGISRLVDTDKTLYTQHVIGSIGYMDPLFVSSGRLTTKSDVYSFGVVLVQLITRKKVRSDSGEVSLVHRFTQSLSKGHRKVRDMFDVEIADQNNIKIIDGIGRLAGQCLSMDSHKRPEMTDVAERLRTARKALQRREENPLFFWRMKNRPVAPAPKPEAINDKFVKFRSTRAMLQPEFDLEDLLQASAEVLGNGVYGTTYRAKLGETGHTLVVKRLRGEALPEWEFRHVAAAIGEIESELVVPLEGYYFSKDEKFLIYENMPMGSLSLRLHGIIHLPPY